MPKPTAEKKVAVPESMIKLLLTDSEWKMIQNRWEIINLLLEGKTIRSIAESVGVGTDTVQRIARFLDNPELKKEIKRFKTPPSEKRSPWVFGKGE